MDSQVKQIWNIDADHSAVQFKVKHLAIAFINGTFDRFKGTVIKPAGEDDFNEAEVSFEIDANSLNTKHQKRDDDLRSALFLDVEQFPYIYFKGILKKQDAAFELTGDLTIRDKTKEVKLDVVFFGMGNGRFNDIRAGFELNAQINRKDFGINWNMLTDAGSLIMGENIVLHFDIELTKE